VTPELRPKSNVVEPEIAPFDVEPEVEPNDVVEPKDEPCVESNDVEPEEEPKDVDPELVSALNLALGKEP